MSLPSETYNPTGISNGKKRMQEKTNAEPIVMLNHYLKLMITQP
jgi:hypothetical protein